MTIEEKIEADMRELERGEKPSGRGCLFLIGLLVLSAFLIYFTTIT